MNTPKPKKATAMTEIEKRDALLEFMKANQKKAFSIQKLSKLFGLTKAEILSHFKNLVDIKEIDSSARSISYQYIDQSKILKSSTHDRLSGEWKPNPRVLLRLSEAYKQ